MSNYLSSAAAAIGTDAFGFSGVAPLTPLGVDMEPQGDFVQAEEDEEEDEEEEEEDNGGGGGETERVEERTVQEDGTVVVRITHKKKNPKKKLKKIVKNKEAGTAKNAVQFVSVAIGNMADSRYELPPGAISMGEWDARLFGCFDSCMPNCLMVVFCPCVSTAQIASRIGFSYRSVLILFAAAVAIEYLCWGLTAVMNKKTAYASGYSYDAVSGAYRYRTYSYKYGRFPAWGYISIAVAIALLIAFWQLRTKVREKFAIPGTNIEDFLVSCCCPWCSLAQMATHVKSYKPGSCDFGPPDELRAYAQ